MTSHHESAARGPDARMADRLLFFSDAVFAIVLTILILDVRPPTIDLTGDSVLQVLAMVQSHLGSFVLSFLLVGWWWFVHIRATRRLTEFDWPTAVFNMLFLLFITLMPFATSMFSAQIDASVGLMIYWGVLFGASITMLALFLAMSRGKGRLIGGMTGADWRFRTLQTVAPVVAFGFGIWAASAGQLQWSRNCWFLIFVVMLIGRIFVREPKPKKAEAKS